MEISSVQKLCIHLISAAFQRCRVCEDLCRLSVVLKGSSDPDPSIFQISIADTGIGSNLEEFQDLKFSREVIDGKKWDGMLSIRTTSSTDDVIYHYHLNLRESISARRMTRLPSNPKSGVMFSGTEVCLSVSESVDDILAELSCYCQKILILKVPNIAIELVVERGDAPRSRYETVLLANECSTSFSAPNFERLESGLQDYVLKHGNTLSRYCDSCFPSWEQLKIGNGVACSSEAQGSFGMQVEVIIIISESAENSSCIRSCGAKTEVLFFKDFTPCSINQTCLVTALNAVDWKSYGLVLKKVDDDEGHAILEWENLPPDVHIDMVLHCYHKQFKLPSSRKRTRPYQNLIKKATKLALDDLKEKHSGVLLSAHAAKICSFAPDLAKSIAGLILSSNDSEFQGECLALLGLQSQNCDRETVEGCIEEKVISVIEANDRKPHKSKEVAPFLFEDDYFQEMDSQDGEIDAGEHLFSSLDF